MLKFTILSLFIVSVNYFGTCSGHGMMLEPAGRSSRWRFDQTAPVNYDDNGLWCGGYVQQWHQHDGKCGLCGDNYGDPTPRANELGGHFGKGVITKTYVSTYTIDVAAKITANHLGYIYYNLCKLDEFGKESEQCFEKHRLNFVDGSDKQEIGTTMGMVYSTLVLPKALKNCKHCVLRWTYVAGNNWGICPNGTGALGCGPQEHFKSCADISIFGAASIYVS